jgi:hypothetical protein
MTHYTPATHPMPVGPYATACRLWCEGRIDMETLVAAYEGRVSVLKFRGRG